jgi:putative nucleotidyltransferase with HDIG domain
MPWLRLPFLLFSFALVLFILTECGFAAGALLSFGVIILEFWGLVFLHFRNLQFDYSYVVNFTILFFVLGSAYKYVFFLYQIVRIKYKATLDPLSNLFTLRYFYYRLLLEEKKIYFGRGLYLVFIHLESFTLALEELPLNVIKDWWRQASLVLGARGYLWSVYSNEEVVGCLVASEERARRTVNLLKVNLDALLVKRQIKSQVRIGYLRLKPNYPVAELLSFLSAELKLKKQTVVLFGPADLKPALAAAPDRLNAPLEMLSSLDADIEEKNQQLLSLIENLSKEHVKTKEAFFQIITSLVNALEARDAYTQGHSERVSRYSLMLAEKLDWSPEQKERLKKAALLHDLGKIGIPDSILHKRGSLTPEEYNIIKQHEVIGVKILQPLKDLSDILPWILHHHERWDGAGYPHGLAGDAIPEGAQVLSLADVFDALTTGRDYKPAFSIKDSLEEIIRNKGTQFNPRLADLFLETIQKSSLERRV